MQVSVEKISNIERRLTIVVPANQVEEEYVNQIDAFSKKAKLDGFRPGKVPRSYIEMRFGKSAREEAISHVIQKSLHQALLEQHLKPVSTPLIEPKMAVSHQSLEFVASFEILPDFEKIHFSMDQVEKCIADVQPTDVDFVIEQLRKQHTQWKLIDRTAQLNDRVVIDYHTVFEGKADTHHQQNFPLELGSKTMIPGFEEGLIGAKSQDERTLHLSFPEDFHLKERAGKPVDFVIQIKQVYEAHKPIIDEQFIQSLGIKSGKEEDMRNQIKQSLEHECNRLVKEKLKEQVFSKLLEQNPVEVPHALIEHESKNIHDEIYQHEQHDHHQHTESEMATFTAVAKKRVTLGLLISEFAKQVGLKTDHDRLNARVQEIASVYEDPVEVAKWLLSDKRKPGLVAQVLEDQVLDKLLENIQVVEKSMSYAELKGIDR